jgi:hypothetical protein
MSEANIPDPQWVNEFDKALSKNQSHPDLTKVTVPALAFFVVLGPILAPHQLAVPNQPLDEGWKRYFQMMHERDFWNEQVRIFRRDVKRGRVITLHDTNHVFFQDPKQVDKVVRDIRDFLTSWKETRP